MKRILLFAATNIAVLLVISIIAKLFVLQILFGVLASMIWMAFLRHREFRVAAGGAGLAGRDSSRRSGFTGVAEVSAGCS